MSNQTRFLKKARPVVESKIALSKSNETKNRIPEALFDERVINS